MIQIQVQSRELDRALRKYADKLERAAPLMRNVSGIMLSSVEDAFEEQGPNWPTLAESTIEQRKKTGHWPGKILQRRGDLAGSIQEDHGDSFAQVGVPPSFKQAAILHFGGMAGRGRKVEIPARPYMTLTRHAEQDIIDAVGEYVTTP